MIQVFNDCTLLLLTYTLWGFMDAIDDPELAYEIGFVFIAIDLANIAVHFYLMLRKMCS